MPPFSPGKRVVVLGAGATRGASTSADKTVQPPLNADFFTQLQRITSTKHVENVRAVMRDVVELFGPNFSLTMEDYFTQLESFATMSRLAPAGDRSMSPESIRKKRDRLMTALAAVLEESTDVSKKASMVCRHHAAIIEQLAPQDTIISFNYDCVVDHALRRTAAGRWSAKYGYTLPGPSRIVGHEAWDATDPPSGSNSTINLLKLHGSLNWPQWTEDTARDELKLKQRLYQQNGTPRFKIIPPEFVKNIADDVNFEALWRNAERAIRHARVIALVGFSFTPTDLHVDALFRIALAGNSKLKTLVIANPAKDHRERIRAVFSRPLASGCMVRQYSGLEDLATHVDAGILG
jgi:hypothetical protein